MTPRATGTTTPVGSGVERSASRPSTIVVVLAVIIIVLGVVYTASRWAIHLPDIGEWGSVEAYQGRDYRSFATAGILAREGDVTQLYDPNSPPYVAAEAATFVYPPWFAVGMMPASLVGFQAGYWIWMAVSLAAASVAMWLVGGRSGLGMLGVMVVAAPGLQTFIFGQTSFFLLALSAVMGLAISARRYVGAGVAGALMAFKPHVIIGVAIAWLHERRRYRWSIASAVVVTMALFAAAEVLLPGATLEWPRAVRDLSGEYVVSIAEITVASVVDHIVGVEALGTATRIIVLIAGFAWFAITLHRRTLDLATTLFAAFGVAVAVSFHAMTYDVLVLLPLLALVWRYRPSQRGAIALFGGVTVSLLTIGPLLTEMQEAVLGRGLALGPIALVAFIVWIVRSANGVRT